MSTKHLSTGSTCPPLRKDTLRLYSMRFCPFAQKARLVLAHKRIAYELVNVNLQQKPDWFLQKNPNGTVPVLEINDRKIYESGVCVDYLDEVYPENKLTPEDPYEKALMNIQIEKISKVTSAYFKLRADMSNTTEMMPAFHAALQLFEDDLCNTFFGGDNLSMVDIHMWPWFEKISASKELFDMLLLPPDKFPKLSAWCTAMKGTEAVKGGSVPLQYFMQFSEAREKGMVIDYDIGLDN